MQILTFTVAGQPYAIPSRKVIEVLPLVPARPIPLQPEYVVGVFAYRGRLVPLIDLGRRFEASGDARRRLSTRVIVVEFPGRAADPGAASPPPAAGLVRLGLIADDVVSIQSALGQEVEPAADPLGRAPFLGRLLRLGGTTVQMLVVEHLLPDDLRDTLVAATVGAVDP